uniref:Putative secreted protein n=1 Tax=Amblyomma triste TaxID=251400 RepID=A0A023G1W9_AMBTT
MVVLKATLVVVMIEANVAEVEATTWCITTRTNLSSTTSVARPLKEAKGMCIKSAYDFATVATSCISRHPCILPSLSFPRVLDTGLRQTFATKLIPVLIPDRILAHM